MSVKQILYFEEDGSYRLKNHKTDRGVPIMRRQTWMEVEEEGCLGLRKHEYRLLSRAAFMRPEADGSLSRKEGTALQPFPVLVHYFRKESGVRSFGVNGGGGGGVSASEKRSLRSARSSKRDEDEDEDNMDEEEEAEGVSSSNNNFPLFQWSTSSAFEAGKKQPAASAVSQQKRERDEEEEVGIGDEGSLEDVFGGSDSIFSRKRPKEELFDFDHVYEERSLLSKSSLGSGWTDAIPAIMVMPDDACALDECVPDCAFRATDVLAVVNGFACADRGDYEYMCTFSDVEVPATLVGDGVVKFCCPERQPGVVNFWVSRRHKVTRKVDYTKHVPFFFVPTPHGDGRLSLAWNQLREIPVSWGSRFAPFTRELDVSFNMLSDLNFLEAFPDLEALIADNNLITGTQFPFMPKLKHLSLNRNGITMLDALLKSFPNLQFLSLLGNDVCPIFSGDAQAYAQYQTKITSQMPHLKILDSSTILSNEKVRK